MPDIALGSGASVVASPDGTGDECLSPTTQESDVCSSMVTIGGFGAVRAGDAMKSHPGPGCGAHAPGLSSYSSLVTCEGRGVGRVGDNYSGHVITTGSGIVTLN